MAYQPQRFLGLEDVRIATSDGEDIGQHLSSIRYNATISAYEIRAPRPADVTGRTIPDLTGRGPIQVTDRDGRRLFVVHFEAVTYVPFEGDAAKETVNEVHILRSARAEVIQ